MGFLSGFIGTTPLEIYTPQVDAPPLTQEAQTQVVTQVTPRRVLSRRAFCEGSVGIGVLAAWAALTGCDPLPNNKQKATATPLIPRSPVTTPIPTRADTELAFTNEIVDTLLAKAESSHGGIRYKSEIQRPHHQTDRDVGAASIGIAFIAKAIDARKRGEDPTKYIAAAQGLATWLKAVSVTNAHGRFWHDYNDDNEIAQAIFTSFDDGAMGIGDFFWQLADLVQDIDQTTADEYRTIAKESVKWVMSQAQSAEGGYRWVWDITDESTGHQMGMGEGLIGIVHTLATYYERTQSSDPAFAAECKKYIDGALRYLDFARNNLGNQDPPIDTRAIPEAGVIGENNDTQLNSGYLSGAAGGFFMYLKLYQVFGDTKYLDKADEISSWLQDPNNGPLVNNGNGYTWKLALDPQGGDNDHLATGFEEGAAGIGWAYLQGYILLRNVRPDLANKYLDIAKQAANWLLSSGVAQDDGRGGLVWAEFIGAPVIHPNLNNGGAGICNFLQDLAFVTNDPVYQTGADKAFDGVMNAAQVSGGTVVFNDDDYDPDQNTHAPYSGEPGYHFGDAGQIVMGLRKQKGNTDIPGEHPGFSKAA